MPKVYYYTDDEVGFPFPGPDADRLRYFGGVPRFIWYEWPGFEVTTDPARANVFVVRQRFSKLTEAQIRNLPHLKGNEERHVFFDLNDHYIKTFPDIPGIFFRSCCTHAMLAVNPNIVLWPWALADSQPPEYAELPAGGFRYDAVFQGHDSPSAQMMIRSLQKATPPMKTHLKAVKIFWPNIRDHGDTEEAVRLRTEYLETMSAGRLILCPVSNTWPATRMRLWEAMAMGRFQVYFTDEVVLSFNDKIDWDECMLRLPLSAIQDVHEILPAWLAEHSDEEIIERGRYARRMWQEWLAPHRWGRTAGIVVREKLGLE